MNTLTINKRDTFPCTERTTHFTVERGGLVTVKLGGNHLGNVVKRDGFFVAQYHNGDLICPREPHVIETKNNLGHVIDRESVPMGPFLKRVREALIQKFFPNTVGA